MKETRKAALRAWLDSVSARCAWETKVETVGTVTCYIANGRAVLVQEYESGGWDVYTAHHAVTATDTLIDASARIGIK